MQSDTILDSHLYIRLTLDHTDKANGQFRADPSKKAHLASQLLLYDRIVIPTKDFGIVPILVDWMGLDRFREVLESGVVGFARPHSLLCYTGNGNGISGFEMSESEECRSEWWQHALFGRLEEAAELQIKHKCPSIGVQDRSILLQLIASNSKPIDWDNDLFMKAIVHESYTDVISNERLSGFVLRHEPAGTSSVRLPWLTGVGHDQCKVSSLERIQDGVDLVLRVAEINMEILMAEVYGQCDIGTSDGAERILEHKLIRTGIEPSTEAKFLSLIELTRTPDVRVAVSSGTVGLSEILSLRNKRVSRKFREWLRNADAYDARELEHLYVRSLGKSSVYNSLPVRALRFFVTATAGALNPVAGPVVSAMDSFFVEKWFEGYSPKLFLDELGKLPE